MYNLGTGKGISVMELIQTIERVNKVKIPYVIQERRAGDISAMYANATLAETELGWKAVHTVDEMCKLIIRHKAIDDFDKHLFIISLFR